MKRRWPTWLAPAIAGGLLLAAIAVPPIPLPRDTVDALVVFDITQSMDVEDMSVAGSPASRLDWAKDSARRALGELPCGSRIGWGAFTEYRTLVLLAPIEVCGNYADLAATLANIDGRIRWGDASEISKGVFWAMRAARQLDDHPAILFVTDGQEAPPLGDFAFPMFDDLKAGDVPGVLLGVGGSVPRPIPKTDEDGQRIGVWRAEDVVQRGASHEQLSALKEAHLRSLGTQTGLAYATALGDDDVARLLRSPGLAHRRPVPTSVGWVFAAFALALLLTEFARTIRWPAFPRRHPRPEPGPTAPASPAWRQPAGHHPS